MSSLSRVTVGTAAGLLVGIALYGGCSSNAGGAPGDAIGPTDTGDGGAGSGPSGVDDSGTAFIPTKDAPSSDGIQNFDADESSVCAATYSPVKLTPVNLIFIVDKSGSMGAGQGQSAAGDLEKRWVPMVQAFTTFFNSVTSPALQASFTFFPAPCDLDLDASGGCVCSANEYNPATVQANSGSSVPLTQIVGHTKKFTDLLAYNEPNGGTPTIAALQGSYTYASSVKAASPPGGVTHVVLITDGAPGFGYCPQADGCPGGVGVKPTEGCPNNTVPNLETLAATYFNQGINTYVFGMGNLSGLNVIATAGGTSFVTITVDDAATTTQQFITELNKIPKPVFDCSYPIEDPSKIQADRVNVFYTNDKSSDQHIIYNNPSCGLGDKSGWYLQYEGTVPKTIVLCTSTCDMLKADPSSALNIQFGCPVQIINY